MYPHCYKERRERHVERCPKVDKIIEEAAKKDPKRTLTNLAAHNELDKDPDCARALRRYLVCKACALGEKAEKPI